MNILEERLFNKFGHRFKAVRKGQNTFEIMELITFYTDRISGETEEFLRYDTYCVINTNKNSNNFLSVFAYEGGDFFHEFLKFMADMFESGEMSIAFQEEME